MPQSSPVVFSRSDIRAQIVFVQSHIGDSVWKGSLVGDSYVCRHGNRRWLWYHLQSNICPRLALINAADGLAKPSVPPEITSL